MASNKRERELARMRAERQAARRAAAQTMRRQRRNAILLGTAVVALVAVVIGVVVAVGIGGSDKTTASAGKFGNTGGTGSCSYTKSGTAARTVDGLPPTTGIKNTGTQKATFVTTRGTVTATLLTSKAPCTVNSFVFLSQQGFYDKTPCPRVVNSGIFVLQCGDPSGTTSGGPGYAFADENLKGATYPAGTLAMANSGGGASNGSQFFMVFKDTQLPAQYTPFGTITSGLDVVTKVAAAGDDGSNSAGGGKPKLSISLTKVTVS
ncbi:MAG: peptidyl-prolyl cis-trans isomerase cyclophilin type [Frankiales bacterium]|nr:peptidyl-prolyl cis-trans isomerase cyclophilin type [Frankiales bacterium]